MNLSWFRPSKLQGVIRVTKPIYSLGRVTDVFGKRWDVKAIIGDTVCACLMSQLHPYYYDTSGQSYGCVSQKWKPYKYEVVGCNAT